MPCRGTGAEDRRVVRCLPAAAPAAEGDRRGRHGNEALHRAPGCRRPRDALRTELRRGIACAAPNLGRCDGHHRTGALSDRAGGAARASCARSPSQLMLAEENARARHAPPTCTTASVRTSPPSSCGRQACAKRRTRKSASSCSRTSALAAMESLQWTRAIIADLSPARALRRGPRSPPSPGSSDASVSGTRSPSSSRRCDLPENLGVRHQGHTVPVHAASSSPTSTSSARGARGAHRRAS